MFSLLKTQLVGVLSIVSLSIFLGSNDAIAQSQDRGPSVDILGSPAAPYDVRGPRTGPNINFPGDVVTLNVCATAYGISDNTHAPNLISEISLWAYDADFGIIPDQIGTKSNGAPANEAYHTSQNGAPQGWVFKWSSVPALNASGQFPVSYNYTWSLQFYGPGYFWYAGEAQDNWTGSLPYSFWSSTYGYYHPIN
ncbi:MAG: hypothetical protein JWL77_3260 [Chthonomonadaceae bacterium]|nr:hypothetical protein [Chthonomonadaceae bacterium]